MGFVLARWVAWVRLATKLANHSSTPKKMCKGQKHANRHTKTQPIHTSTHLHTQSPLVMGFLPLSGQFGEAKTHLSQEQKMTVINSSKENVERTETPKQASKTLYAHPPTRKKACLPIVYRQVSPSGQFGAAKTHLSKQQKMQ